MLAGAGITEIRKQIAAPARSRGDASSRISATSCSRRGPQSGTNGRNGDRGRRAAVGGLDPGRDRLRSLHESDLTQAVAAPSCGGDLGEHRRERWSDRRRTLASLAATIFRASCAGSAARMATPALETPSGRRAPTSIDEHLNRIRADPAIDTQRVVAGSHGQKQGVADLGGRPRQTACSAATSSGERRGARERQLRHLVADRVAAGLLPCRSTMPSSIST